jgi:tripartite-type tricarboxylate transporter receptor subunit TctC
LKEFVAYAKANPDKLSYGHPGVGSTNHLMGELFKSLAGIPDMAQVPYRGTAPALTDLISGQIAMVMVGVTGQLLEFHRGGKLRILAVTKSAPLKAAPEIQTATQAGFPQMTTQTSYGLLAPAGTPRATVEQIAQATRAVLASEDYQRMLTEIGFEPVLDSGPDEFRAVIANDLVYWSPIVKALGVQID